MPSLNPARGNVTVTRAAYVHQRVREFIVKDSMRRAARHRAGFGRFAVIPTEYVGSNVIANGLYERHQLSVLRDVIAAQGISDTVALDIGANIGNHAVVFARWFRDVLAFEPNPSVAALLEANVTLSGASNVKVYRVGLGAADALLPFTPDTEGNDGHGSFAIAGRDTISLPVKKGDDYLAAIDPDLASGKRRIGFIKCDVEGFEPSVFTGLMETLRQHAPIIAFESDNRSAGTASVEVLMRAGYSHLYAIRETGDDSRGRLSREVKRLLGAYRFWLEPVEAVPDFWCNLVATTLPLR
jgi:FkbM family methyltransferase